MRTQEPGYNLDFVYMRREHFTETEHYNAYPCHPIGEVLFCEVTLTDDTGHPILRTYGPTPIDGVLKMEWLLEEQGCTGPLPFLGKLIDECSPRRSLHHGERCSEQQ